MQKKIQENTEYRTHQQNRALHLWLEQCAEVLRNQGLDMRKTLIAPIIPTKESLKELILKPIMQAMFAKKSTTELLKKDEIDAICDVIRSTFNDLKIELPQFPSLEETNLIETYETKSSHKT